MVVAGGSPEVRASGLFPVFNSTLLLLCVKCKHWDGLCSFPGTLVVLSSGQGCLMLLGRS